MIKQYPFFTKLADVPSLLQAGTVWVPVMGHRVTPEMVELRQIARSEGTIAWRDQDCEPGYFVRYTPADSPPVSAMGRIGR